MAIEHKSGEKYYNKTEIENAKNVDLLQFLQDKFPNEIERDTSGRYDWRRCDDHSIQIFTDKERRRNKPYMSWCDWTAQQHNAGDNINYLKRFHGLKFTAAVEMLLSYGKYDCKEINDKQKEYHQKRKDLGLEELPHIAPERNDTYKLWLYDYLENYRKIDKRLLDDCIKKGSLYTDNNGNCVFLNTKTNFYFKRNCDLPRQKERWMQSSSGVGYWIYTTSDEIETLYICESPIDCLSLCTLQKKPDKTGYIAMLGLKPDNARKAIEDFPNAKPIIAVDWDKKGKEFYFKHFKEYKSLCAGEKYIKHTKDWNEMLVYIMNNKLMDKLIEKEEQRKKTER